MYHARAPAHSWPGRRKGGWVEVGLGWVGWLGRRKIGAPGQQPHERSSLVGSWAAVGSVVGQVPPKHLGLEPLRQGGGGGQLAPVAMISEPTSKAGPDGRGAATVLPSPASPAATPTPLPAQPGSQPAHVKQDEHAVAERHLLGNVHALVAAGRARARISIARNVIAIAYQHLGAAPLGLAGCCAGGGSAGGAGADGGTRGGPAGRLERGGGSTIGSQQAAQPPAHTRLAKDPLSLRLVPGSSIWVSALSSPRYASTPAAIEWFDAWQ